MEKLGTKNAGDDEIQEPTHAQPEVLANPYDNQYQQPYTDSYIGGYVTQASHPPMQQSTMFVPHQAQPALQPSFTPAPASHTQPSLRTTFVPSTPPALKNAANVSSQPWDLIHSLDRLTMHIPLVLVHMHLLALHKLGSIPTPRCPKSLLLVTHRIYSHDNSTGCSKICYRFSATSKSSNAAGSPYACTPPPTIETADTSKVPAHQRPVIATLTRLFKETSEAMGGARANPAKKREIEDNSRKLGALFVKLNSGDISKNAADKLGHLCQALDNHDFSTALQIQVLLTTNE